MSYLVFARKFRPQTFNEIVGQETIVTTLKNAIRQSRIPQNFIFSGPRGIGKTSTARILAKALNCSKGPTEDPCGKCPACVEITQGSSLDVLEIDGASNRGIDEIRNLRETVKFKPVNGRFKVYIIDEVHMLTSEAFNALLKTLEEPPPHVKFVFATTESHKVPLTILSRCHRFNFKRVPVQEIASKLEEIAKLEKLKADKKALFLIAKASEGSLRDAEGLLDQSASFAEEKIKEEDVLLMLGLAPEETILSVLGALKNKDAKKIFEVVRELYDGGNDLVQFAKALLEVFRHLLLIQCSEAAEEFIEMSEEGVAALKKIKNDFSRGELLLALSLVGNLQNQLRRNLAPPKILVETALLKLLHLDGLRALAEIDPPSSGNAAGIPPSQKIQNVTSVQEVKRKEDPGIRRDVSRYTPTEIAGPVKDAPPRTPEDGSVQRFVADKDKTKAAQEETKAAQIPAAAMTLNEIESLWPRVVDYVKGKRMSTGIFLSESEPIEAAGSVLTLGLPAEFQFHKEMLEKNTNRELIEEAFNVVGQKEVRIQFVITRIEQEEMGPRRAPEVSAAGPAAIHRGSDSAGESSEANSKLSDMLSQALNIFDGAKIVRKE